LAVAFRLPARVLKALTPALAEGSLEDSLPGDWVESRMARIGTSPMKPGMGERKLFIACIQKIRI
jgi:hypothetical protein